MLMSSSLEELRNCMVPTLKLQGFCSNASHATIRRVTELRCLDDRQISPYIERMLIEIVVRIAHVRVFRLVTYLRRKFRVTAMDVWNF
jgi:hypothetical protein